MLQSAFRCIHHLFFIHIKSNFENMPCLKINCGHQDIIKAIFPKFGFGSVPISHSFPNLHSSNYACYYTSIFHYHFDSNSYNFTRKYIYIYIYIIINVHVSLNTIISLSHVFFNCKIIF